MKKKERDGIMSLIELRQFYDKFESMTHEELKSIIDNEEISEDEKRFYVTVAMFFLQERQQKVIDQDFIM